MREQNRELTYYIGTSLDGFIAGPEDQVEPLMVFADVLEAIKEEWPETLPTFARESFGIDDAPNRHWDTLVMGRRTYDPGLAMGVTSPYAHMEQYVFTNEPRRRHRQGRQLRRPATRSTSCATSKRAKARASGSAAARTSPRR